MGSLSTPAIVLHALDYQDASRIIKLLTRDAGLRSALARGAKNSRKRFGSALDLFAQGTAELQMKQGRELDTLASFDVAHGRSALGADLDRFAAASAIAEILLRFTGDDADPALFDSVEETLDQLTLSNGLEARVIAVAGMWRILAALGFSPSLDRCGECRVEIPDTEPALFNHASGGVLCETCGRLARVGRVLPAPARRAISAWITFEAAPEPLGDTDVRAHQRLLREFVHEHLAEGGGRPLKAFEAWEHGGWSAA